MNENYVRRRAPGAGRKKLLVPCPYCALEFGARDLRTHLPACRRTQANERKSSAARQDVPEEVPRTHPRYSSWIRFRSQFDAAVHGFNSASRSARGAADYLVEQYDLTAKTMVETTIDDYASADRTAAVLDMASGSYLNVLSAWMNEGMISAWDISPEQFYEDVRNRLLRRAEHWKEEAYNRSASSIPESPEERATRRQAVLDPLLKNAGIDSDESWADKVGQSMHRNTPRDYRRGKTKRLRSGTRKALARALGINDAELPQ